MTLNKLKAVAFIAALAIVSATTTPGDAEAGDTICKNSGHDCHAYVGGQWHHLQEYI